MAKISTYPIDGTPSLSDKVIGTEVANNNETKNYLLSDIFNLFLSQGGGGGFVPYIGAIANVNLGSNTLTSSGIIITSVANATVDTDKFLVLDGNVVKYRTGAQLASDIGAVKSYGSFYDVLDQTITTASIGQPALIRNTDAIMTSGFSVVSNSRITAANSGKYNIMFSFQFHNNGGGGSGNTAEVWFVKNGLPLAESNTRIAVPTNAPYVVAAWNYFVQMNAGDYVQIFWSTDNANIGLDYSTSSMGGPAIPSVIVTINQVD